MEANGYSYDNGWLDRLVRHYIEGNRLTEGLLRDCGIYHNWNASDAYELRQLLHHRAAELGLTLPVTHASMLYHPTMGIGQLDNGEALPTIYEQMYDATEAQLIPAIPTPAISLPTTPARPAVPRIQVNVRQAYVGTWAISCKVNGQAVDIPRTAVVKSFLPREYRPKLAKTSNHYASERAYNAALSSGALPAQVLADAIKAHLAAGLSMQTEANSTATEAEEASQLMRMQPATIIAGGVAYRMVPVGGTDLRNPLRQIRLRAREQANREAATLREAANRDSTQIVRRAEEAAQRIRRAVEVERERARAQTPAPQWLMESGRPFYRDVDRRGQWTVIMKVATTLEYVEMAVSTWNKTLYWDALPITDGNRPAGSKYMLVSVSMQDGGQYSMDSCVAWGGYYAPHVSERACMTLQGLPARLDSLANLQLLENAIGRGNRVINMGSLLSGSFKGWHPWIQAQVPMAIQNMLKDARQYPWPMETMRAEEVWPAALRNWDKAVEFATARQQVFHVPDLVEGR